MRKFKYVLFLASSIMPNFCLKAVTFEKSNEEVKNTFDKDEEFKVLVNSYLLKGLSEQRSNVVKMLTTAPFKHTNKVDVLKLIIELPEDKINLLSQLIIETNKPNSKIQSQHEILEAIYIVAAFLPNKLTSNYVEAITLYSELVPNEYPPIRYYSEINTPQLEETLASMKNKKEENLKKSQETSQKEYETKFTLPLESHNQSWKDEE